MLSGNFGAFYILRCMLFGSHQYAPHVLSAVRATFGSGRRRRLYQSDPLIPWYVTLVLNSGTCSVSIDSIRGNGREVRPRNWSRSQTYGTSGNHHRTTLCGSADHSSRQ